MYIKRTQSEDCSYQYVEALRTLLGYPHIADSIFLKEIGEKIKAKYNTEANKKDPCGWDSNILKQLFRNLNS